MEKEKAQLTSEGYLDMEPTTPKNKERTLLDVLREEKQMGLKGEIYHRTQIGLTYNSNHIEGSQLTHDQTRYIFETNTLEITDKAVNVDDIVETVNHFRCIDLIIDLPRIQLIRIFAPINKNNKGKKECRIYHNGELICRSLPSGSWSRLPNGQKQGA